MMYWKTGFNQWTASAALTDINSPVILDVHPAGGQDNQLNPSSRINLRFSPDGRLISVSDASSPDELNQGNLIVNANFRVAGDPNVRDIALNLGEAGVLSGITQFASTSTTKAVEQDGYNMGYMGALLVFYLVFVVAGFAVFVKKDVSFIS
jgi:flagellar hook protein FlgE